MAKNPSLKSVCKDLQPSTQDMQACSLSFYHNSAHLVKHERVITRLTVKGSRRLIRAFGGCDPSDDTTQDKQWQDDAIEQAGCCVVHGKLSVVVRGLMSALSQSCVSVNVFCSPVIVMSL